MINQVVVYLDESVYIKSLSIHDLFQDLLNVALSLLIEIDEIFNLNFTTTI